MKESHRLLMIIALMALMVTIVGCGYIGGSRNENANYNTAYAKFYKGTRGVEAVFKSMPTRFYYYGPQDQQGNMFNIGIDIHNRGASYTRGAVFLSGYDPNLIVFEGFHPGRGSLSACGISFGSIGFGQLGGIFRCDGVEISGGQGITNVRIDSWKNLIGDISKRFPDAQWLSPDKFDMNVNIQNNPAGTNFLVNFNDASIHADYFQHGRLFIAYLAGLDFIKLGGREFLLAANDYNFPGGEATYFDYKGTIVDWPAGLDQTKQSLLLTSCYQYTTYADPIVCIDPEPFSDSRKVCRPQSRTWSGGNGAPVSVTSVEQENTPRKIIFRINVKNVGRGTVYDAGQLEKCSPYYPRRTTPADLNVVDLGDVRVGTMGLAGRGGRGGITCYPERIRLDPTTRAGSTTCTYPMEYGDIKSAYQTPLVIELWYGYSEAIQRDMYIKRVI
jgi:hypothetical protein